MKNNIIIGALCAVLLMALAIPAFAAATDAQKKEIADIFSQMAELRKQMLDKYVDAGVITKEQAELGKKNIDQAVKNRAENPDLIGPGYGCGGAGIGGGAEIGGGYGCGGGGFGGGRGFMRGFNNGGVSFNPGGTI
ncbi:MAG: YckD family protein [Thermincola sp.]|jgi:hypothetical protein|nr:YckD family protein [Thermincola sp.]MDT3704942.1 YckD family protein [Thermincola sp.]